MNQPTAEPTHKVKAVAVGSCFATLSAWGYLTATGETVPPGVEAAFAGVISFFAGYMMPERVR